MVFRVGLIASFTVYVLKKAHYGSRLRSFSEGGGRSQSCQTCIDTYTCNLSYFFQRYNCCMLSVIVGGVIGLLVENDFFS